MNRINYLMNGLAALAFIVLFSQCAGKADNQVATMLSAGYTYKDFQRVFRLFPSTYDP